MWCIKYRYYIWQQLLVSHFAIPYQYNSRCRLNIEIVYSLCIALTPHVFIFYFLCYLTPHVVILAGAVGRAVCSGPHAAEEAKLENQLCVHARRATICCPQT
jgi:benzoyl-CoA reductase/2-hydroxyglutaryl-CoA dehydratase subunit BcrC/BadD/HgdB